MSTIAGLLAEYPPLSALEGHHLESMAEFGSMDHVAAGNRILRTGEPANTLFVIRHGRVAIEIATPHGGSMVIETLEPGELVGVSWMLPPYRLTFDARCVEDCGVIVIDAARLREACDANPDLGYALFKHVAGVVGERLQATRLQLLDVYGGRRDT